MKKVFILLSVLFVVTNAADIPSCFKKCTRNDVNLSTCVSQKNANIPSCFQKCTRNDNSLSRCLAQNANEGWPQFVKDYKFDQIPLNTSKKVPNFADGTLTGFLLGFEDIKFNNIFIDFNGKAVDLIYSQPIVTASGDYTMKGGFLGFALDEYGKTNITYPKGIYKYRFNYDIQQRDGENYIKINTFKMTFNHVEKLIVNLTSVGNPERGRFITTLFQNNWRILNLLLETTMGEVFSESFTPLVQEYFNQMPLKSMFG